MLNRIEQLTRFFSGYTPPYLEEITLLDQLRVGVEVATAEELPVYGQQVERMDWTK